MITNRGNSAQKVFVLDSKYYRYGETKNPNHLPDSSSVVKQIAYAQYIDNHDKNTIPDDVKPHISNHEIYNAFIMPGKKEDDFKNIGFVSADYVLSQNSIENNETPEKPFHKIHGILIDIRQLMNHHAKSNEKILELEKSIIK